MKKIAMGTKQGGSAIIIKPFHAYAKLFIHGLRINWQQSHQ
jgi:hypothetical protein